MREIVLTRGYKCHVDDVAYGVFKHYRWMAMPCNSSPVYLNYIAQRAVVDLFGDRRVVYLHRMIAGVGREFRVEFRDGNWLNMTSENIRICDRYGNWYVYRPFTVVGVPGKVVFDYYYGLWRAEFHKLVIGYYTNELDAIKAYNVKIEDIKGGGDRYKIKNRLIRLYNRNRKRYLEKRGR